MRATGDHSDMSVATEVAMQASPFVVHDPAFLDVLGESPRLELVVEADAHEGPVYAAAEDALYFTSLPRPVDMPAPGHRAVAIRRVAFHGESFGIDPEQVTTLVEVTNTANGMTLDATGHLLVCEQGSRSEHAAISRIDPATSRREVVVDAWWGLRLNSPNDIVVAADGAIWFTDPTYGHLQGFRPEPQVGDHVYRYDPATGRLTVVADDFDKPNGLAFSPDGSVLYVTDSGANQETGSYYVGRPHHIVAFDVAGGRRLVNRRLFAVTTPGFPDGIKVDTCGRVYASAFSGVQVFAPDGDLIGEIRVPGAVNFTFGGADRNVLYITADTAIWAAVLDTKGA
jgi:gluconolactonase